MIIITDYEEKYNEENDFFWIECNESPTCTFCGGKLEKKGWVPRVRQQAGGSKRWRKIEIRRCTNSSCGASHRLLPDDQVPFKHYGEDVIEMVVDEDMTPEEELEIEDHPCDETKSYWKHWAALFLVNAEGQFRSVLQRMMELSESVLTSAASLIEEMKKRLRRGWMSVILRITINTGGLSVLLDPL